jgi:hypothetical protein
MPTDDAETGANTAKLKLLEQNLEHSISVFHVRRDAYRKKAWCVKAILIACGILITSLLGINGIRSDSDFLLSNCALVISAIATGLTSYESFSGYRELWIQYTVTVNQLYHLKFELDYWKADGQNDGAKRLREFADEFEHILAETNNKWLDVRKPISNTHGDI